MATDHTVSADCQSIDSKEPINDNDSCLEMRRKRRRKRLAIATLVLFLLLLAILITAIVLFSYWSNRITFQEKQRKRVGDRNVDEELYQDTVDSLTMYHIQDNSTETWVILDYNREIEITKVRTIQSTQSTCYVKPHDSSKVVEKNQTKSASTTDTPPANVQPDTSLPVVGFRPLPRPITEKSMLGKRGQELCADVDTFWILSTCNSTGVSPSDGSSGLSRTRRTLYYFYSCYMDWLNCFFYYFADRPYTRFYGCNWVCGYQTINY